MSVVFFHIDLDAFFASVEILDDPSLAGKPVIIGSKEKRSVCSTCSYEARKYGVHSAMPMETALRLCPDAIVIRPRGRRYSEKSREVMDIIRNFAPGFLQVSVDEAFLDYSGMENIHGLPGKAARLLKEEIRERTGLTASIGVASSRFVAKLASDYRKPDGLTIVPPGKEELLVDRIGLEKLWGIGEATLDRLHRKGLDTPARIRRLSMEELSAMFSPSLADFLYKASRGIDPGIHQGEAKSHSISTEETFWPDIYDIDILKDILFSMAQELTFRALDEKVVARTVQIKLRYGDFTTISAQTTPSEPLYGTNEVFRNAEKLLMSKYDNRGVRLLGLSLAQTYEGEEIEQRELFAEKSERERRLEKTALELGRKGSRLVRLRSLNEAKVDGDDHGQHHPVDTEG